MSENEDSFDEDEMGEFVPAVVARSAEEAETYRVLLDDHDIPAIVATDEELDELAQCGKAIHRGTVSHGMPVFVPESLLDEAGQIISEREGFGDLDLAAKEILDDDDESELDVLDGMTELDEELEDELNSKDSAPSGEEPFDVGSPFGDDTDDPSGPKDSDDEFPDFEC